MHGRYYNTVQQDIHTRTSPCSAVSLHVGTPVQSLLEDVYAEHGVVAVGDVLCLLLPCQGGLVGLVPSLLALQILCLLFKPCLGAYAGNARRGIFTHVCKRPHTHCVTAHNIIACM